MGLPFTIVEGAVFIVGPSGDVTTVTPNKDLLTADIVNTAAVSKLLTLTANTPAKLEVTSGVPLANRKVVMATSLTKDVTFGFGSGAGQRPFPLYKNQSLIASIGPAIAIWFEFTAAGADIAIAELS